MSHVPSPVHVSRTSKVAIAAVLACGVLGFSAPASAGGWYDDDDYYYRDYGYSYERYAVRPARPIVVYPVPPPVPVPVRPYDYRAPVYGWVYVRPPSCGKYRYWDGDSCRDARYDAPYVGPRW